MAAINRIVNDNKQFVVDYNDMGYKLSINYTYSLADYK